MLVRDGSTFDSCTIRLTPGELFQRALLAAVCASGFTWGFTAAYFQAQHREELARVLSTDNIQCYFGLYFADDSSFLLGPVVPDQHETIVATPPSKTSITQYSLQCRRSSETDYTE